MSDAIEKIDINVKVQVIYFQTANHELGLSYDTSEKRITIKEAEEILFNRSIEFKEVLKVKYEYINIILPLEIFKKYIN